MKRFPTVDEARDIVLKLGFPPITLALRPSQAIGHRLAKPVLAKGPAPSRPFAVADGLAVKEAGLFASPSQGSTPNAKDDDGKNFAGYYRGDRLTCFYPAADLHAQAPGFATKTSAGHGTAEFRLRPAPTSNRREDALQDGEAISIPSGGEIPRGGEVLYPFSLIGNLDNQLAPLPEARETPKPQDGDNGENGEEALPVKEPAREWDMAARLKSGRITVDKGLEKPWGTMVPIGAWAKQRDVVIQERTIIRPTELALMEALEIEEVEVFRRPVVGVVSIDQEFPTAQSQGNERKHSSPEPLLILAASLMKAARVAALPLGRIPDRFKQLSKLSTKWLEQVDLLVIAGGSHSEGRSLGNDFIEAHGKSSFSGIDLQPGSGISAGTVNNKPVISIPGSLGDVLAGIVLVARPLAHRYLLPHQYLATIELELENGSSLYYEHNTAVPVRYGQNRDQTGLSTRFSGRIRDPWMDYIRGQALVVFEGGKHYQDGDQVTAHMY